MKLNIEHAQRILDDKPMHKDHLYIDSTGEPRDRHIENLFRDLFGGGPLDTIFRTNFGVYFQELLGAHDVAIKPGIFIDAAYAQRFLEEYGVGIVKVRMLTDIERKALVANDSDFAPVRYVATIKSPHAKRVSKAYAPSALHATLLAAVLVYRAVAAKRLNKLFAPAYRG